MFNNSLITSMANNQNVLRLGNELHFYSYDSYICGYNKVTGILTLNSNMWDYSNTTRKYFKKFLEEYTNIPYIKKDKFVQRVSLDENIVA